MEYAILRNGVRMPMLGYGVYQIAPQDTAHCVEEAAAIGYRSFDTAQGYFNEAEVGLGLARSGVPRKELFLTTKIWISNGGYERAKASIEGSLRRLRTDYIDLLLIHQAFNDYYGTWRAMEEAYRTGKVRAIGVSNFLPDRFIDLASFTDIPPMVEQLEVHAFYQQKAMRPILARCDTQLMAWAPLAEGRNGLFTNETLSAIGEKYGKTAAQVDLRFLIQSGVAVIPKSVHKERMKENLDIFDFQLTDEDMAAIEALAGRQSLFIDFRAPDTVDMFVQAGKV